MSQKTNRIFVLTHGVRSKGGGMDKIRDFMYGGGERSGKFKYPEDSVKIHSYRKFPALFSAVPFRYFRNIRDTYSDHLGCFLEKQVVKYPDTEINVIAHSFGTYLLQEALYKFPQVKLNKVILLGSVMDRYFPWRNYLSAGRVNYVYNWVGTNDWVQFFSSFAVVGMGASGRIGFSDEIPGRIENIYPEDGWGHLSYAEEENIEKILDCFPSTENYTDEDGWSN